MADAIQSFIVVDPRTFDGDPFEVAERAINQTSAVLRVGRQTLKATRLMARNAEMERQLLLGGECDALAFENGPQARRFDQIYRELEHHEKVLSLLGRAAAYNPRKPIR